MTQRHNDDSSARTKSIPGTLYIVGTPIGNLEDISQRALRILSEVHRIAAEDTRHTRKLLTAYEIKTPLLSLHEHNEAGRVPQLLELLEAGHDIAVVSDAGMPGISDPGAQLVRACTEAGIPVIPIPGPTAFVAGLVASGLATERFAFEGFLPRQKVQRAKRLSELQHDTRTLIFYEAPHRLRSTLGAMCEAWGDRRAVLAREITKLHEEYIRGTLLELLDWCERTEVRGEFVVLVEGAHEEPATQEVGKDELRDQLQALLDEGMSVRDAVRSVATTLHLAKSDVYDEALRIKNEQGR